MYICDFVNPSKQLLAEQCVKESGRHSWNFRENLAVWHLDLVGLFPSHSIHGIMESDGSTSNHLWAGSKFQILSTDTTKTQLIP